MEIRERNSINHSNPPPSNQESSPRFSSAPSISSPTSKTIIPDHHLHLHQKNHYHGLPRRDPNPDPDPDPAQPVSQPPLPPPQPAAVEVVRYRECLKNHAATMGTHVVDGCGEFMPAGEEGTPQALKCAACECHRSFHRKEESEPQSGHYTHGPPPRAARAQPPPAQHHRRYHHSTPPIMMAFGGTSGAPAESSSEGLNIFRGNAAGIQLMQHQSRKRFRTKFTQEQKEKMHDFAERIGWRIQKQDEQEVVQFCNEVGLKRKVFKVWMHNNKHTMKEKLKLKTSLCSPLETGSSLWSPLH